MAVMGHQFGGELAKLLGLPKHTRAFTLRCAFNEAVSVECEYFPEVQLVGAFETVFARYDLVERTQPRAAQPVDFDAWLSARKEAAHAKMMRAHLELSRMDARLLNGRS